MHVPGINMMVGDNSTLKITELHAVISEEAGGIWKILQCVNGG